MRLIQPVLRSTALLADIEAARPGDGEVAIWWLGQSGYALKTASALVYVDLYLSEHLTKKYAETEKPHIRMTEAPLRGDEITNARWVFSSHKHSDHLDPETLPALFRASPEARLVLPAAVVDHAIGIGLPRERLIPMRGNDTLQLDAITAHAVPSAHPDLDYTPALGYPFLGFVFEMDGMTIYHSGDTVVYDGLADHLRMHQPDLLLLPINGTSERLKALGTPPNMSAEDAVELAQNLGGPPVIPHHYDMFTFNTVDVSVFTDVADRRGQSYHLLRPGERTVLRLKPPRA